MEGWAPPGITKTHCECSVGLSWLLWASRMQTMPQDPLWAGLYFPQHSTMASLTSKAYQVPSVMVTSQNPEKMLKRDVSGRLLAGNYDHGGWSDHAESLKHPSWHVAKYSTEEVGLSLRRSVWPEEPSRLPRGAQDHSLGPCTRPGICCVKLWFHQLSTSDSESW